MVEKVAVVGAGLMGRWHSHFAKRCGAEVDALVDLDAARARALADKIGCPSVYASVDEMLERSAAQVIHICTPTESHAQLIRTCAEKGRHVLVEKPLAADLATTQMLVNDARTHGIRLNPVHQFCFQRGFLELLQRLTEIGNFVHVEFLTCSAGGDAKSPEARRSVMLEILPHPLSLLCRLLGADGLRRHSLKVLHATDDDLYLFGEYEGATVSITISLTGRPTRNQLNVIGTAGSAHLDLFHGFALFEHGQVSRSSKVWKPLKFGAGMLFKAGTNLAVRASAEEQAYPGLRQLIAQFYAAVKNKTAAPILDDEIIAVAEISDLVRLSTARK
ncbi:MAG TPA: Gfo/Idh/MocA family oxidoreductase [Trichormus sp.]